jgi:hypothetical protein
MNPNFLTAFHRAMQQIEQGENDLFWSLYLIQHKLPQDLSEMEDYKVRFKDLKLDKNVSIKKMVLRYYHKEYWRKFGCHRIGCREGIRRFERMMNQS